MRCICFGSIGTASASSQHVSPTRFCQRVMSSSPVSSRPVQWAAALDWSSGDFNYDGTVNGLDFAALAVNFGQTLPAASAGQIVPEPAVALTLVPWLLSRRRR
jgi:hypothetical protein